jgi:hydroxymethylbilane synthase
MGKKYIIIGSRSSILAIRQAEEIKNELERFYPTYRFKIRRLKAKADTSKNLSLAAFDSAGVFTKDIDSALISGDIDIAVHSMKDLPTELTHSLAIACVPKRLSPYDVLISRSSLRLKNLPMGAGIGTSSPRRNAFLLNLRNDLRVEPIRGNIDTRIRKLDRGDLDGIVVAEAALRRIGLENRIAEVFKEEDMLPQAGQGALAIVVRDNDVKIKRLLKPLNHRISFIETMAEREFLNTLGGGCRSPVGILAKAKINIIKIKAAIVSPDGKRKISKSICGDISQALELARNLAEMIKKVLK